MSHHHNHSHASHHKPEAKPRGLRRWQKNLIHGGLLVAIAITLYTEGAKTADALFLLLSVATEIS